MIPLTTLCDECIDRSKLTEQKNHLSVYEGSEQKCFLNEKKLPGDTWWIKNIFVLKIKSF